MMDVGAEEEVIGDDQVAQIYARAVESAANAHEYAALAASGRALRVLIVEDHRDTARALADLVEAWGCRAAIAATGRDARQVAARFHPRVVLLDLGLPDEHGYTVAEDLRKIEAEAPTFVVVSGWSPAQVPRADGIAHHLVKPVDTDVLRTILARHQGVT